MREKSFDSINVVPFIDIMLVLLTIVLATATFIKTGIIPVELPSTSNAETYADDMNLFVDISPEGVFYYASEPVTLEILRERLAEVNKNIIITVRADKSSHIQPFAELMGLLKDCGFESINLQTEMDK